MASSVLVIASQYDEAARDLVAQWAPEGAALCAPRDLSRPGWRYCLSDSSASTAVAGGIVIRRRDISGVLVRLFAIPPEELQHIVPEDRCYVASEMTAFLTAWLSSLSCPIVNRPTAGCLSGPAWRPEQWIRTAGRAGIPVMMRHHRASPPHSPADEPEVAYLEITVACDQVFGTSDDCLVGYAKRLAAAAGVSLVRLRFARDHNDYRFVSAHAWPDLRIPGVADAIKRHLVRT